MTKNNNTNIVFTGDLSFSAFFQKGYQDDNLISNDVLDFISDSNATIINYESPITPLKQTKKRRLAHRTDPEALDFIKDKFPKPILSFANNHMMDYRSIGFIDSVEEVIKKDIPFIGAGRNRNEASRYEIIGDDVKVGVLSIQYKQLRKISENFIGPLHEDMIGDVEKRLVELRPKVDWIVLIYHGGDEFLNAPMPYTRNLIKKYLKMDIDLIVAHHPHVVQGYEYFNNKMVFYSLGNFIFDTTYQRAQEGSEQGMLVKLTFNKKSYSFENLPVFINRELTKIEKGEDNPFFIDLTNKNYKQIWTYEAMRKKESLERAKVLRESELAEMEETKENKRIEHEQRVLAIALSKAKINQEESDQESDFSMEENDEPKNDKNNKSGFKRTLKKVYTKLITDRNQNYRALVMKFGRLRYKLFYKDSNPYD